MEMVWDTSLKRLYLSSNNLGSISWNLCQLSGLQDLDMSHNNIRMLPKPEFWTCSTLHKLNLSFNKVKRLKLVKIIVAFLSDEHLEEGASLILPGWL